MQNRLFFLFWRNGIFFIIQNIWFKQSYAERKSEPVLPVKTPVQRRAHGETSLAQAAQLLSQAMLPCPLYMHAYACSALHCSVLLGVLFLWCMLCLINVPLPTGRGGGGAGRGPHVPDQPPQGSLYRMPSQMTPPQAATVFYNSQYGWVLLSPIRFSCSPSLKSLEPGRRNTYSRSPDPCTAQPSWAHDDALVIWALPDCLRTRVFVASAVCVRTCLYHRSCPSSSWDPSTPQLWIINWQGRHMSISRPCHSVLSLTSCSDPERIAIVTR